MTPKLKWLLALVATAVFTLVAFAAPAAAQVAPDGNLSPDTPVSAYFTVNNTLVLLFVSTVVPLVNGLLLRPENPAVVKALVANLFAAVAHAVSQAIQEDGTALFSQEWLVGLVITLVTMAASYYGVWKPMVDPDRTLPTVLPVGDWLTPRRLRAAA